MRAIGVLVTVSLVRNGLLDLHPFPIRIQFIGDNQRQTRADRRAHLRAMRYDPHRAVRVDSQVHARMQRGAIRMRIMRERVAEGETGVKPHTQHQSARRDDASPQKAASADVVNCVHAVAPAAALIAARIRWYVPHRQIFPAIASSIS
jgi:hypothetical protein